MLKMRPPETNSDQVLGVSPEILKISILVIILLRKLRISVLRPILACSGFSPLQAALHSVAGVHPRAATSSASSGPKQCSH